MTQLTSEQEAIARCRQGDQESFAFLYDRYVKKIYNFVYYKTFHKETAEDLTSKIFFKALNGISSFNPDKSSFSTWIFSIARNAVIDHYRTAKEHAPIDETFDTASEENISANAEIKENLKLVRDYLNRFPEEQREIVVMRLWDELPYEEISQIVGKTPENCRVIFSRSLQKLREQLASQIYS